MRAVLINPHTTEVTIEDVSIPLPGPKQVLIRIQSCALNRIDLAHPEENVLRKHWYRRVPGIEIVGTIAAFGDDCSGEFQIGDQVFAMINEGGLSEFAVADEGLMIPALPDISSHVMNAIPVAFITAYHVCFISGRIVPGDTVLVHGGAGSVAMAMIQLLIQREVTVVATIRDPSKRYMVEAVGAHEVVLIDPSHYSVAENVHRQSQFKKIDVVLDCIGGEYMMDNLDLVRRGGRIIIFGMMGIKPHNAKLLEKMMEKDITLSTSNVVAQTVEHKRYIMRCLKKEFALFSKVMDNSIKVFVDNVYNLDEANEALERLRSSKNHGKIIVLVTSTASAIEEFAKELKSIEKRNRWTISK
jgi:NADPH:quinone reductase-like Zn-dependent oxidoreductase